MNKSTTTTSVPPVPSARDLPPIYQGYVEVASLVPHPKNYREHPDTQLEALEDSLDAFTQYKNIVVQERVEGGHYIVAGEGISTAARRRGDQELSANIIPASWPPELVEAILAADNEHQKGGVDNTARLATLMQSLQKRGLSLRSMGSSQEGLNKLLAQMRSQQSVGFLDQYRKGAAGEQQVPPAPADAGDAAITSFGYEPGAGDGSADEQEGRAWQGFDRSAPAGDFPGQQGVAGSSPGADAGSAAPIYFNLTFTLLPEQRELVLRALSQVKRDYDLTTSQDALVQVCGLYSTTRPAEK